MCEQSLILTGDELRACFCQALLEHHCRDGGVQAMGQCRYEVAVKR